MTRKRSLPGRLGFDGAPAWVVDTVIAALLGAITIAIVIAAESDGEMGSLGPTSLLDWITLLGPVFVVPIRRLFVLPALFIGAGLQIVMWLSQVPDFFLAMSLLIFTAAATGRARDRWCAWGVAVFLTAFTGFGVVVGEAPLFVLPMVGMLAFAAASLGVSVSSKVAFADAVATKAEAESQSRLADQDRALTEERNRIARELHDVVAHGLSVVVVQAAAAQRILDRDPEGARSALTQIEHTGRTALTEMRHVLSIVRTDPEDSWRPARGLDGLPDLVADLRQTGLPVTVTNDVVDGDDRGPLPATVELTAFRIVQESLTNVLKHGGPGVAAEVHIERDDDLLRLTITDNGRGSAAADGDGHGLRGMQERVEVFGGQFSAKPKLGGGFAVKAELPIEGVRVP